MRGRLLLLARDERGAAMVEFGLLAVPLMGMIMGFAEMGYQSYVRASLQSALNDVARSAVVETPRIGGTGAIETRIEAEVKKRMNPLVRNASYVFDIQNFTNFSAIDKPEPLVTDKDNDGRYDSGDCWLDSNPNKSFDTSAGRAGVGGADDVVVYEVRLSAPHLFPVMGFLGVGPNFATRATALVRTQPYAQQREPEVVC